MPHFFATEPAVHPALTAAFANFKNATALLALTWELNCDGSELGESYGELPDFNEVAHAVAGWEIP